MAFHIYLFSGTMKGLKIVIVIFILIMSLGTVCAADSASDDGLNDLEIYQDDIIADNPKTFTDLSQAINDSDDSFELDSDYKFSNDTALISGISINKTNFTINGNNHILDADNQSAIFNITGNNITINDLVFKNGHGVFGAALYIKGHVTLNNVTFIGNNVNRTGGAIYSLGNLTVNKATFINNTAVKYGGAIAIFVGASMDCHDSAFVDNVASTYFGSAIYSYSADVNISNIRINSKVSIKFGQVGFMNSKAKISNITFMNLNSSYSPALFFFSSNASVFNCRFINLTANRTAGAININEGSNVFIKDCEFINTKSIKNAGAVNVNKGSTGACNVTIVDCLFKDTISAFGGALIQLGGNLVVNNSDFIGDCATFNGGAIFISNVTAEIDGCTFDSNAASVFKNYQTYGGAIYCDLSNLTLTNSRFINNSAGCGNAIYAYDSSYVIADSTFANNTVALFTHFDRQRCLDNNTYNGDGISTNNTDYQWVISCDGLELELINNVINVSGIPSRFDLREWRWVSSVKNQEIKGFCWVFSMMSSLESSLLRATGVEYDFSENNLGINGLVYARYGDIEFFDGGNEDVSMGLILSWIGPVDEQADNYDTIGRVSYSMGSSKKIHVQDVFFIPIIKTDDNILSNETNTLIKKVLLEYGAVTLSMEGGTSYLNEKTNSIYHNETNGANHLVSIVGWDDSYSKDNFNITPPGDGAWIFKNSWGTDWGDGGYAYISYYDTSLFGQDMEGFVEIPYAVAFIIENTQSYNRNYQTDFMGIRLFDENYTYYSNEYTSIGNDLIGAVGTYFNDTGAEYEFRIYVNGELRLTQTGVSEFAGFRTIALNKYIPVKAGDEFKVVFKNNPLPVQAYSRQHYLPNISMASVDGKSWIDFATLNKTVCLKAYTVADDTIIINNKDVSVDYAGGSYFTVNVVTADGHAVGAGEKVTFTINKRTVSATTDANGIAKIKIEDVPGKYTIKTAYNGKTYANTVTVKQVLTSTKVTVKKTAKKFTLKSKLKINGKLVKGKTVTFKFNGKTYKVKTNSKGIAQKTLNKKVINKLKKGKTYTVKVTYLKDTIKTTVKVR